MMTIVLKTPPESTPCGLLERERNPSVDCEIVTSAHTHLTSHQSEECLIRKCKAVPTLTAHGGLVRFVDTGPSICVDPRQSDVRPQGPASPFGEYCVLPQQHAPCTSQRVRRANRALMVTNEARRAVVHWTASRLSRHIAINGKSP